MKKVIRLTERQLENIIHRVISEQTKDDDGGDDFQIKSKLSQITDNEAWNKFVNGWHVGSITDTINVLNNLGLKKGSRQMGGKDASINLISFFNSGLSAVAKTGVVNHRQMKGSTFVRALDSELATKFKTSDVLKYYPNYYEVLSKLAEMQIEKMG
jgi:hypothetical protein